MKNKNILGWEISHWQYNNIIPIVVSIFMMALSYGALLTRVSVIETKLDTVIEQQKLVIAKFHDVETRYGELSLKVERLETIVER